MIKIDKVKEENIAKVEGILGSLGNIERSILSNAQKIQFAYLIQEVNFPLRELFNYVNETNQCKKHLMFVAFCEYQLKYKYEPTEKPKSRVCIPKEKCEWLRPFDLNTKFTDKNGQAVKCYYMNKEGTQVEVTAKEAIEVINALRENQIPDTTCIVNEAIRRYALNELDVFVEQLTSGNYLSIEEAKKSDTGSRLRFRVEYGRIIHI